MATIILVIHLMIAVALVAVVLLQRSEGGALGIGGGGGGGGGFMSGRGAGDVLTRATGILAGMFFITSLSLGIIAARGGSGGSLLDNVPPPPVSSSAPAINVPAPLGSELQDATPEGTAPAVAPDAATPADPEEPAVPRAQ
ncbi:MAG: preprotein translocase subunit SecG [Rhizobiales bacterium]|nr:preprotein translocase subunit SecG [Hyphomicrobiales bacterium]